MKTFENTNVISIRDFSKEQLLHVLKIAESLEKKPQPTLMQGKVMGALFFEPSTRTRLSFETAMNRLGGKVVGFASADVTSSSKGETLSDTIKMVSGYVDVIAMRHPIEGAARLASEAASVPIINGGDGANQHPSQTLLDMYTIKQTKGTLEGLTIGFVGDLKYGRTVHSLALAMAHFKTKMLFIAPAGLEMPKEFLVELNTAGIKYEETTDLEAALPECDIVYNTRIQKERFPDEIEYEKAKGAYVLDEKLLPLFKKDMKILHPLPRVDELSEKLDDTPHAAYFQQAKNGVVVREAIIALVTGALQ